ncbi:MAG: response regulator [Nitrospirae bacterium]|nr:response regulator [Nitrospirota bacterium]
MNRILIVDDDQDLRDNLSEVLQFNGFVTNTSASAKEALDGDLADNCDIMLLDLIMPGVKGLDAILGFIKINPKIKIIVITAFATIDSAIEAIKKGACEFISKPFDVDELLVIIRRVIEEARFEQGLSSVDLDGIMGTLSNSLRRKTIKFLDANKKARFSDIIRELSVEDNAKAAFHLKILRESNIIEQDKDRLYKLTKDGERVLKTLKITEKLLFE